MRPLRIGVTLGDPRGIGPEVTAAAARQYRAASSHQLVLIGPAGTLADGAGDDHVETGEWHASAGMTDAGRHAGTAIDRAIELARTGDIDAVVTAPIDKAALHTAGFDFPGHTEMFASRTGSADVVMLMTAEHTALGSALRVVLATTHMPLAAVPLALTADLLVSQVSVTVAGLRDGWDIASPRVALCAFNPHASDGGLFGDEEQRVYEPAIATMREHGLDVSGPVPADTVFLRAGRGEFDVVIAPYHDVGMAAFKTASFGRGVNVTLGLPFPRTSPDHGTALDIAGTGRADASSMFEAITLAVRLATVHRNRMARA